MNSGRMNIKSMALGAMLAALTVITLWAESVVPVNRMSLYALSSFYIAVMIIECGIGWGWTLYAVSALLAFIIVPDKLDIVMYLTFFGIYGAVKFHIEQINKIVVEYALKLLFFNINLAALIFLAFWLFSDMLSQSIVERLPLWVIILLLQPVFIVYDYVYTLFIGYYRHKLRKLLQHH